MHQQVQELLHKEMTRQEFVTTIGLGLAALLGFSSILKIFGSTPHRRSTLGYGSNTYGK